MKSFFFHLSFERKRITESVRQKNNENKGRIENGRNSEIIPRLASRAKNSFDSRTRTNSVKVKFSRAINRGRAARSRPSDVTCNFVSVAARNSYASPRQREEREGATYFRNAVGRHRLRRKGRGRKKSGGAQPS